MAAILFSKTGFENMMEVVDIYPEFVFSLMFKVLESIEIMPTNSVQIKQIIIKLNTHLINPVESVRYLAILRSYLEMLTFLSQISVEFDDDAPHIPYVQTFPEFLSTCDLFHEIWDFNQLISQDLLKKYDVEIDKSLTSKENWGKWTNEIKG